MYMYVVAMVTVYNPSYYTCREDAEQVVVVKVFAKHDPSLNLQQYNMRLHGTLLYESSAHDKN